LLFVDVCGDTGATSHEIIDGLDLPRATVTEMLARLRRKQMVFSQKVMDEGKRRTIYQITDDGQTVADSWQLFLRSIGPRLRRVLRLED
jgi:DNA-binding PadR family transcriptional regulator